MMHRRDFMRFLGMTGAAAGVSSMNFGPLFASENPGEAPKRLIVLSTCHGWPYDSWKLRPGALSDNENWEVDLMSMDLAEFSQPLAPLFPHRQRLLIPDGLSLGTAELDIDGYRHEKGWIHAWTGNWIYASGSSVRGQSQSLDQIVASHVARPDRLPSLEIAIQNGGVNEVARPINYAGYNLPMPREHKPSRVWDRLFGPSQGNDPLTSRQRTVLDFARAEYDQLSPKLNSDDREKMARHFDLVQQLQSRLEGMAHLTCESLPDRVEDPVGYDDKFDAFAEMVAMAFACDATRVATLSLGETPTTAFDADHITDDVHKGLAHEIYNDPEKHQAMTDFLTLHAEQVSRLVSLLESIPDSDGNSVMDNTLIVWGSELANGWHGYLNYCPVLIGGSWFFNTGRYIHWPHETPIQLLIPEPQRYSEMSGKPHQQLLVSVAQAMGLDINHVGIEHAEGQNGHRIDCTGPLPDLT